MKVLFFCGDSKNNGWKNLCRFFEKKGVEAVLLVCGVEAENFYKKTDVTVINFYNLHREKYTNTKTLLKYCLVDRRLDGLSQSTKLKVIDDAYGTIERFLNRNKFTTIFCEFSNYISIGLLEIGKLLNCNVYTYTESQWEDRFYLGKNSLFGIQEALKNKNIIPSAEAKVKSAEWLGAMRNKYRMRSYIKEIKTKKKISSLFVFLVGRLRILLIFLLAWNPKYLREFVYLSYRKMPYRNLMVINHKLNLSIKKKDYYLFFLHCSPELSVDIWSYDSRNQDQIIIKLSKVLAGKKLIVKEHPYSFGRSYNFINNLKKKGIQVITSVSLTENLDLIRNSCGVITLTGSVALEAVALGVNAYNLGNSLFSEVHGVRKLDINQVNLKSEEINNEMLIRDIALLYDSSMPGNTLKLFEGCIQSANQFGESLHKIFSK
jgi:hypothetical protein